MRRLSLIIPLALVTLACSTSRIPADEAPDQITSNPSGLGTKLEIEMIQGEGHNHPLMAIWVEDQKGNISAWRCLQGILDAWGN